MTDINTATLEDIERRTDAWHRTWLATCGRDVGDERNFDVTLLLNACRRLLEVAANERAAHLRDKGVIATLFRLRHRGHLRARPDLWDSERGEAIRATARTVVEAIADAMNAGGATSGRLIEMLRERGVPVTISDLHGAGLQSVAAATCGDINGDEA